MKTLAILLVFAAVASAELAGESFVDDWAVDVPVEVDEPVPTVPVEPRYERLLPQAQREIRMERRMIAKADKLGLLTLFPSPAFGSPAWYLRRAGVTDEQLLEAMAGASARRRALSEARRHALAEAATRNSD